MRRGGNEYGWWRRRRRRRRRGSWYIYQRTAGALGHRHCQGVEVRPRRACDRHVDFPDSRLDKILPLHNSEEARGATERGSRARGSSSRGRSGGSRGRSLSRARRPVGPDEGVARQHYHLLRDHILGVIFRGRCRRGRGGEEGEGEGEGEDVHFE